MGELSGEIQHGGGLTDPTLLVRTHDDWRVGSDRVLGGGIHAPIVAGGGYGGVSGPCFTWNSRVLARGCTKAAAGVS